MDLLILTMAAFFALSVLGMRAVWRYVFRCRPSWLAPVAERTAALRRPPERP